MINSEENIDKLAERGIEATPVYDLAVDLAQATDGIAIDAVNNARLLEYIERLEDLVEEHYLGNWIPLRDHLRRKNSDQI